MYKRANDCQDEGEHSDFKINYSSMARSSLDILES